MNIKDWRFYQFYFETIINDEVMKGTAGDREASGCLRDFDVGPSAATGVRSTLFMAAQKQSNKIKR